MYFAILFSPSTLGMLVAKTLLRTLGKGENAAENWPKSPMIPQKLSRRIENGRPGC